MSLAQPAASARPAAALLTIPAIVVDQSASREAWQTIGGVLNWTIWLAFAAEIVIMVTVALGCARIDERLWDVATGVVGR